MAVRFSSAGLVIDGEGASHRLAGFLDCVLRGVGQVMLQNNSYTGLLFVIGICLNSLLFGAAVLLGTVASTATAMLLRADRALVGAGLFGFNGGLVGIALLVFLQPTPLTWGCVIVGAACSTFIMAAMLAMLDVWRVSPLTAPFVFTSLCFLLATTRFGGLQPTDLLPAAALPTAVTAEGAASFVMAVEGLFNGIAQVFLQESTLTGIVFAAGLFVASRLACAAALAGSLAGLVVALGMGAAEPVIHAGLYGFNSVLVAIALGGAFFALDRVATACALFATITTPIVVAATSAALEPLGLPALTLPFVLVTWLFLFARRLLPEVRAAEGGDP